MFILLAITHLLIKHKSFIITKSIQRCQKSFQKVRQPKKRNETFPFPFFSLDALIKLYHVIIRDFPLLLYYW